MPGIFVAKGMTVSIPSFSIRIRDDGTVGGDDVTLHLSFDVAPTWLRIAERHVSAARIAAARCQEAWNGSDDDAKVIALENEFESVMQAIMATAISWEAIYAVLVPHVNLSDALIARWRKGRTARYVQVTEVIRRAFSLRPKGVKHLRDYLRQLYRFRDFAVHPSSKPRAAVHHPDLDVGMEWRFVYFRAANAETAFAAAAGMLWDLSKNGKARNPAIAKYQALLRSRLQDMYPDGPPAAPSSVKPI